MRGHSKGHEVGDENRAGISQEEYTHCTSMATHLIFDIHEDILKKLLCCSATRTESMRIPMRTWFGSEITPCFNHEPEISCCFCHLG